MRLKVIYTTFLFLLFRSIQMVGRPSKRKCDDTYRCSRPKRDCKDVANEAIRNAYKQSVSSDSEADIYDDASSQTSELSSDSLENDTMSVNDDILDADCLTTGETSEDTDDEVEAIPQPAENLISSSGRVWQITPPPSQGRTAAQNVINFRAGPRNGINPPTEREAVLLFLDIILEDTVLHTNQQGRRQVRQWNNDKPNKRKVWKMVDNTEMEAFIGLLIVMGAFKAKYRPLEDLWSARDGIPICRATMSMERFQQIKSALRFDDPLRRDKQDPLAPVRSIASAFNKKLREVYVPSEWLTVDEQLLEFHGRVQFKQYIGTKPGKFGMKLIWLCDAISYYALNFVIYIGKGSLIPDENVTAKAVTLHLMQPYLDTGRHLTGDNWFSSVELAEELKNRKTSYIGTLRSNSRGIAPIARSTSNRVRKDTRVYYSGDGVAMISFWDKGTKPVLLIDTLHRTVPLPPADGKCVTVLEYNRTKSGVDIFDKRVRGYSCKRKCRRWPFAIFSNMIDIATNNGCIIFGERDNHTVRVKESHYEFLKNAAYQLVDQQIQRRLQQDLRITKKAKDAMVLLGYDTNKPSASVEEGKPIKLEKKERCEYCPSSIDRKTAWGCPRCKKPICLQHRSDLCKSCSQNAP
jgi:hypothetical protein